MTLFTLGVAYVVAGLAMVLLYGGYVSELARERCSNDPDMDYDLLVRLTLLVLFLTWPFVIIYSILDWAWPSKEKDDA